MKFSTTLILRCLKNKNLPIEDRNALVVHILGELQALPLSDIIYVSPDGQLLVRGRSLDMEQMRLLRESASVALTNHALTLIREQVTFEAITLGIHKVENPEQLFFARAALWWGNEVEKKLLLLAQRQQEPSL